MADLTLVIDDETLNKARIHAIEQGTSVDEIVRQCLVQFIHHADAERKRREAWIEEFEALAEQARGGSGGHKLKRDDLHHGVDRARRR